MLTYYFSADKELKRTLKIVDLVLTIAVAIILIIVSNRTTLDFMCFMLFLCFCFFEIIFSCIIYLLMKRGLN